MAPALRGSTTAIAFAGVLCASSVSTPTASERQRQPRTTPQAEFEEIASLLRVVAGAIVADVDAGGGSWTFQLANRVGTTGRVFATDVKVAQVDGIARSARARGLANVTTILGSQDDTGLPANCCDAILLRLVYHAFDEPPRMRESLRQALKLGGLLLVIDFRPAPDVLTREMKDAGFERVRFIERWQGRTEIYAALFERSSR